ncbi:hypothetical protein BCR44DRAFT_1432383 [Catenaria anguillulae PL171]|uniref:PCI domain-containing protein n=1 Tax=Catenaria anguillulae PL171 TaxID=765915 RepID=A0A1Y2HPZ0_9FUNG|nr:hypothetical protein BCR44DRAFT_1432383 [Catenaria anguillulae PL171]
MSDFDDDFMDDVDEADFEYEEDDSENDDDIDLENVYYGAKALIEDDQEEALAKFQSVVDGEPEPGKWAFKAHKQLFKVTFRSGNLPAALTHYRNLLAIVPTAVSRNDSEKSINNLLDLVSGQSLSGRAAAQCSDLTFLEHTNLKLAKLYLDRGEYARLAKVIKLLHAKCRGDAAATGNPSDDQRQGTQLLEIYALEIQMYSQTKNNKKLKELYAQCLAIKSAIPSPRIMGIIRECGGKMYMSEGNWKEANAAFFDSFKNYDDAGSSARIQVLKYLVLSSMLAESDINPFDSQETKPYKTDSEIVAMTDLVAAYQRKDIREFEKILRKNHATIMSDAFIREYIDDVLRSIRSQAIVSIIQPYTRMDLGYLAQNLKWIQHNRLELYHERVAHVDQAAAAAAAAAAQAGAAEAGKADDGGAGAGAGASAGAADDTQSMYAVMNQWCGSVTKVSETVVGKLATQRVTA